MKWLRYCFPTFVALFYWLRERLTVGGAAILLAMIVCTPAILQTEPSVVHLFSSLAGLLGVTALLSFLFRPRLELRFKAAPRVMRGETITFEILLTNLSQWTAYDLQLELCDPPASWEMVGELPRFELLGANELVRCAIKLRAKQRGEFSLPAMRAITTFPLNLIRRRVIFATPGVLFVYPRFPEIQEFEIFDASQGAAGRERENAVLSRGSSEYLGNREYQPGAPVRRWDYSSWARLGRPIIREYLDVQPSAATILVDTHCASHESSLAEIPAVEAALALAARLTDSLIAHGWTVEKLVTGANMLQAPVESASLAAETMLDHLASVLPTPVEHFREFRELVELNAEAASTLFLILNRWDSQRQALCEALNGMGVEWSGWLVDSGDNTTVPELAAARLVPVPISQCVAEVVV